MPRWLEPGQTVVSHREIAEGAFLFTLDLVHPWFGTLVHQEAIYHEVEAMLRRIVLIGATGFFGRRLAQRSPRSRASSLSPRRAAKSVRQAIARELGGRCDQITAIAFDRDDASSVARPMLSPWLVIDASGPFQSASYDLARAALGLGAHWIDLADARDYLLGFGAALDPIASVAASSLVPARVRRPPCRWPWSKT